MINLIRSLALVLAMSMLLLAEFLHPIFHNHSICLWEESQCLAVPDNTPCFTQDNSESVVAGDEHACPICATGFLTYCANDSANIVLCDYRDIAVSAPLPDFVFVEINLIDSPRAPPVLSS